jgi:hypothetical protein
LSSLQTLLQITRRDSDQEVIAHIRLLVDAYDRGEKRWQEQRAKDAEVARAHDDASPLDGPLSADEEGLTYVLRSAVRKLTTSDDIQDDARAREARRGTRETRRGLSTYDDRLREFFATYWEAEAPYLKDGVIKVRC